MKGSEATYGSTIDNSLIMVRAPSIDRLARVITLKGSWQWAVNVNFRVQVDRNPHRSRNEENLTCHGCRNFSESGNLFFLSEMLVFASGVPVKG
jgi:hypothetical protein